MSGERRLVYGFSHGAHEAVMAVGIQRPKCVLGMVAAGLVLTMAVAAVAVAPAGASVLVGGMTATSYQLPNPPTAGYGGLSSQLTVLLEPGTSPYFWSQQFWFVGGVGSDGGYIGLQANGLLAGRWIGKMAICSIWNAMDTRGGSCETFGGEGVGFSCRAPYPWQEGDEVRLSVSLSEAAPSGTWWRCAVENLRTGAVTTLGEIEGKSNWSGLQGSANTFAEYFEDAPSCNAFPSAVVRWRGVEASPGSAVGAPGAPSTYGNCANSAQAWCGEYGCYHATGFNSFSCKPSPHVLCIDDAPGDRRFRVTAIWENQFDNSSGSAKVVPRTSSTGFLYFTDPSNYELIVKILNFGGAVKVFFAELTNLHFTVTVTDTQTGRFKNYTNTPGDCGAIDENAFAPASTPGPPSAPKLEGQRDAKGVCTSGPETLCLLNRRFAVTVRWMNQFNGSSGQGHPRSLSDASGLFSFTDPSDVELVMKAVEFQDRVAFFYGALSDFEYDLTVADTAGGTTKTYHNPAGNYCGGFDNNAFPP